MIFKSVFSAALLAAGAVHAQPLNLDFEQTATEGLNRPWGWAVYAVAPGATVLMDSTHQHSGRYSLRIAGELASDQTHSLGYWVEPWSLSGKKLTLKGWFKTDNPAGKAVITLGAYGSLGPVDFATTREEDFARAKEWTPWSLEIAVDTLAYTIFIVLEKSGPGSAWFDDLSLWSGDRLLDKIPVAPPFSARELKQIDQHISWLLENRPKGARMLVWAHDAHINRGEHPNSLLNYYSGGSMGAFLHKKYGNRYRAFGLSTYDGAYNATISFSNHKMTDVPAFPSPPGSFDEALHRLSSQKGGAGLLLDLRPLRGPGKKFQAFSIARPVRFVGYAASDYGYGAKFSIPWQFDGLIFIDRTRASTRLK